MPARKAASLLAVALACGCTAQLTSAGWQSLPIIDNFSELEAHVGERIVLVGVWKNDQFENRGIYLNGPKRAWYSPNCVYSQRPGWPHRARVRIEGTLLRSPCAEPNRICLETACQDYYLSEPLE